MSESERSEVGLGSDRNRAASVFIAICMVLLVSGLILPAFQHVHSRGPSQALLNLRQIRRALSNYCGTHGTFPFDPRGSEYALYLLASDLPSSCFDSYPHERPQAKAHWDHAAARLSGSDFEYLNWPGITELSSSRIVLAEKALVSSSRILCLRCDGLSKVCPAPCGPSREILGSWQTLDGFLVEGHRLYNDYEIVPLPKTADGSESSSYAGSNSSGVYELTKRTVGCVDVHYEYRYGKLIRRLWRSPTATIIDSVTTDDIGRIIGLQREPKDWKAIWPIKATQ